MIVDFLRGLREARLDELLAGAVAGGPVLLRARRSDTLEVLLERCSTGRLGLYVEHVSTDGSKPLAGLLAAAEAAGARADDLAQLIASPDLRFVLFVADGRGGNAAEWRDLAGAFASAKRNCAYGPALVLSVDDGPVPAGCLVFDDGDLVGPPECGLLAHVRRPGAGLLARAADAAAIEVARGDERILEELLGLGEAERFDPRGWVLRRPRSDGPAPLRWRGTEAACPFWLAHEEPGHLRRRVWRGHLGVLLPWLEEVRATFLDANAWKLAPLGESGGNLQPVDFEWGHVLAAMRSVVGAPTTSVDAMRRLRNDLAHGNPAEWSGCCGIEAHAERLMGWS